MYVYGASYGTNHFVYDTTPIAMSEAFHLLL